MDQEELGIYIHIPFCVQKCYYCDFTSYAQKSDDTINQYIECLIKEINQTNELLQKDKKLSNKKVTTIFIGGGTPTSIDSKYIFEIVKSIKENFNVSKQSEITIEANPGTVNENKLKDYLNAGINRISIGLQTTNNELLKTIGRIHTFEKFIETYNLVKKTGFTNINVDLMIGLPEQKIEDVKISLNEIINLDLNHISVYSLIVEEDTKIEKMIENKEVVLPDEDIERKMYWTVKKELEKNGYLHYEISNFAKKGYESKHNLNCWEQKEYLGFGIASHSYFEKKRFSNIDKIKQYIENINKDKFDQNKILHEEQTQEDMKKEYMLLGLRKIEGVNISKFKEKFNSNPIYIFRKELDYLVKENLLEVDENQIKLTNKGLDLANLVWEEFV